VIESIWFMLVAVMIAVYVVLADSIWGRASSSLWWYARTTSGGRYCGPSVRCGMAMKYGCWPAAARCTSRFRRCTHPFSGFYLPLMMVLWLLILRGIAARCGWR